MPTRRIAVRCGAGSRASPRSRSRIISRASGRLATAGTHSAAAAIASSAVSERLARATPARKRLRMIVKSQPRRFDSGWSGRHKCALARARTIVSCTRSSVLALSRRQRRAALRRNGSWRSRRQAKSLGVASDRVEYDAGATAGSGVGSGFLENGTGPSN